MQTLTATETLTTAMIASLRQEAAQAGDFQLAQICENALQGVGSERTKVADAISEARGMDDDAPFVRVVDDLLGDREIMGSVHQSMLRDGALSPDLAQSALGRGLIRERPDGGYDWAPNATPIGGIGVDGFAIFRLVREGRVGPESRPMRPVHSYEALRPAWLGDDD